jgi:RNA polymerase sigma factor (TIGR02999 family)
MARHLHEVGDHGMKPSPMDVTQMLVDCSGGNKEVLDQLMPFVYDELRRLAARYLRRERQNHTFQPTALVHEAYLRLIDQSRVHWQNRAHFLGMAATMMRRILINHAQSHKAAKRGGGSYTLSLDAVADWADERDVDHELDLLAIDGALTRLAAIDNQQSRVVELRYFGGLTVEETGEVLDISPATVHREWRMAKAWLRREISKIVKVTSDQESSN